VPWRVEILNETVAAEIAGLPADMQARFLRLAERIGQAGLESLSEPHVKHLEGKLWELRLTGRDGIARALCHGDRSEDRRGSCVREEDTEDAAY
jgi:phage-related protein